MFTLTATPPFDFEKSLVFIKRSSNSAGSSVVDKARLMHAAFLEGKRIGLTITLHSGTDAVRVEVESDAEIDEDAMAKLRRYVDNYLSLSDDLASFYAVASKDKKFAPVLEKLYGYHQVRFPTPLESAVWAILSQRTPQVLARKLMTGLAARFGEQVAIGDVTLQAFPEPNLLIAAPVGELRDTISNERKAASIQAAAKAFASAKPDWLRDAPCEFVESWLREIPGIGEWSASLIMIRGLGRMESVNLNSAASVEPMLGAAQRVYGYRFDAKRLAAAIEKYGPSAGYWLHYLRAGAGR